MKHKLLTLLLAVMASVGMSFAETYSGSCGENLTWSLNTEDGVLTISGTGAMADYQNATQTPWNGYSSLIQSVIMNDNVTTVSNYAFAFCSNLKNVSLNQTLTTIGEHAFFSCPLLESVVIPDNVIVIGYNAFAQCSWLTSVHIGNKVTTIGKGAFARCGRLSSVVMFNSVTSIGENAFDNCSALTTINIPNSITSIGKETFAFCAALTSIEIPESVTSIGENAFYGCSGLTSIAIPNSVTTIGNGAFAGCTGLTSVTIGNSVTSIGGFAFEGCRGLTSITNYAIEPQTINSNVFTNVDKSTCTLYVPAESVEAYQTADVWKEFGNILAIEDEPAPCIIASGTCGNRLTWELSCDSVLTISGTGAMTSYSSDTIVPWSSYRTSIASVVVGEGITRIANYSFQACENLRSVTLPTSVTEIRDFSFSGCTSLISIEIPNSVTRIRSNAFWDCDALTSIAIPYSVTNIQDQAFRGCNSLNSINVDSENPNYTSVDGVLFNKEATELIQYPAGKNNTSYSIPNSVTSIGKYAFYDCNNLTSVEIPNSVTLIGWGAFCGCEGLTSVTIPNSVTSIGDYAFSYCNSLTTVTLPDSITSISMALFEYSNRLTSVIIPDGVTSIGYQAFLACSDLTSITIPNSVISIENYAFYGCRNLTAITNYAITPQTINTEVFSNFNKSTCTLYVPAESVEAYQAAEVWKEFTNILPIEGTGEQEQGDAFNLIGITADRINVNSFGDKGTYSMNWIDIPSVNYIDTLRNDMTVTIEGIENFALQYKGKPRDNILKFGPDYLQVDGKNVVLCFSNVSVGDSIKLLVSVKGSSDATFTVLNGAETQDYVITRYADNVGDYVEISFIAISDYVEIKETTGGFRIKNVEVKSPATPAPCVLASGTCGAEGDNLTWTLTCDSVLTISGTGAMADSHWTGSLWYANRESLKSIVIEDGVTSIGDCAFYGCSGLTSITIPNSVTNIGVRTFCWCSSLTSVTIPNSVTSIGEYAFVEGCGSLTSINVANDNPYYCSIDGVLFNKAQTILIQYPEGKINNSYIIPNSVTSVGEEAFYYCNSLVSVTIPNSVTSIKKYAFYGCSGLTSIAIPNSVISIGDYAFKICKSLTSINVANDNPNYCSIDGVLFNKNLTVLILYPTGKTNNSCTIPNSVTSIENYAFYRCRNLTSITNYASTPQAINANVFEGVDISACTLYIPAQSIALYQAADVWKEFGNILAIDSTEEAEILSIGEAIQIGMALDSMATSAETYTIEGYVINAGAFNSGAKYQNWYMVDDLNTTSSDFQAYKCYPIDGIDTVEVRNGSKVRMTGHLQKYYDRQKALYVVEMTYTPAIILSKPQIDTITVAEALALGAELEDNASTGKQYTIRGYVSSVSQYYEQLGDQDFYIADDPNSTANTNAAGGFYVYRGVPSTGTAVNKGDLVELTCAIRKYVPASGTNIKIENSEFPISVTVLHTASDTCIIASGTCGAQGDNLTWTLSCDSVLTISGTGAMADYEWSSAEQKPNTPWYSNRESIKFVIIEDGVTSIGRYAFYGCSGLTSIEIPNSVTSIGDDAFSNCRSLTSIEIPNSVTSIGDAAFYNCSGLTSVTIPNSVTSIGRMAFYTCSSLTSIDVAIDNTNYSSIYGVLFNKDQTSLIQYPGAKQGAYTIPNSVTSIGERAFYGCSGLTSVTIPNSVTSIGMYAFYGCSGLTSITNHAIEPQTIDVNVFNKVNISACTLYVPAESVDAYKAADVWKDFGTILPIGGTTPPQESDREGQSTEGKDFWVTFMQADQDPNNDLVLSLSISSRENCQVQISNPYTEYMESFYVTGGQTQIVQLYQGNVLLANARTTMANSGKVCYAGYSEQVDTCALRVTATSDISLFATNYKRATFDATNVLPTALLGDEYIIQTYTPSDHGGVDRSQGSHFAIIATEDNTIVDYCPTVMTQTINNAIAMYEFTGGVGMSPEELALANWQVGDTIHTPVLMAGQVFYVWTGKKDGDTGDLSGTHVKARDGKRIAVFQGNPHTNVPYMIKQRDQLYSQAMPVRYWGTTFALTSSATRPSDIIRVMAVHDGTEVYINGEPVHTFDFTVDTKHFWEFEIGPSGTYAQEGSCMLATSHPVGVHLFLTSQQYYGDKNSNGDPAMTWVSPIDQQMDQVTFATYESATGGMTSYVNVVTDRPELMTLDALSIASDFSPVSGSNIYYYARIPLSYASHTLKSNGSRFNAHVYGINSNESYAFSAGSFIEDLSLNIYINGEPVSPVNDMCVNDTLFMDITTSFDYQSMKLDFGDGTVVYATDEEGIHARHAYDAPGVYQANVVVASNNNRLDSIPIRIIAGRPSLTYEPLNDIYAGDSIFYIYYHSPIQEMQIEEDFTIDISFNDAALQDGFGHYTTRLNRSFFGIRIPEGARAGVEYAFNVDIHTLCGDYTATIPFVLKARRKGNCGDNLALTWTYDPETKTLTITGDGALNSNYTFGLEAPLEMEQLIIAEGVTSIGANAFSNMSTLQTMQLPASLKTIGASAFENDINLTAIYNYRERPCLVDATAFNGVNKFDCTLYVLEGSVDMYKSSISDWKDFYFILPIGTTEVTEPVSDVTVEPHDNSATVTWPTSNNAATYTIQITKDGVVFCTLIFNANGQLTGIAFAPGREGAYHAPAAIMTANGLQFTVTGLNSNTKYSYSVTAKDSNDQPVATYSGEFTTTSEGIATGVEEVSSSLPEGERGRLILRNGQIYILRGEKVYSITGQEVR